MKPFMISTDFISGGMHTVTSEYYDLYDAPDGKDKTPITQSVTDKAWLIIYSI